MKKITCLILIFTLLFSLTSISTFADIQNLDKNCEIKYIDGLYYLNTKNIDKEIDKEILEEINKMDIERERKESLKEFNELKAKQSSRSIILEPDDIKAGDVIITDGTSSWKITVMLPLLYLMIQFYTFPDVNMMIQYQEFL